MKTISQKLRKAIENEGRLARIEGLWWQFSLTERTAREPSAVSLLKISRGRDGALELTGRAWQEDGALSARYWSEAVEGETGPFRPLLLLEGRTARSTRTRRNCTARARSGSNPPTAPRDISRRFRTRSRT